MKDVETETPTFETQFLADGKKQSEKNELMHNFNTALSSSAKLLKALVAIMGIDVWTAEVSQVN